MDDMMASQALECQSLRHGAGSGLAGAMSAWLPARGGSRRTAHARLCWQRGRCARGRRGCRRRAPPARPRGSTTPTGQRRRPPQRSRLRGIMCRLPSDGRSRQRGARRRCHTRSPRSRASPADAHSCPPCTPAICARPDLLSACPRRGHAGLMQRRGVGRTALPTRDEHDVARRKRVLRQARVPAVRAEAHDRVAEQRARRLGMQVEQRQPSRLARRHTCRDQGPRPVLLLPGLRPSLVSAV